MENRKCKGVINYFVNYTSIFSLTPWRNSIQLLHEAGYKVTVYQFADERMGVHPTPLEDAYTLIGIHYPIVAKYALFLIKTCFRSLRHIGLRRLSSIGDGIDFLFRNYYFIAACLLKNASGENEVFIGGDPGSLIAAHYLATKKRGTLIYWSLELYLEKNLDHFGIRLLKKAERKCNRDAFCTMDFGEIRCAILREENNLEPATMISIPNSQIGPGKIARNYFFNDMFNIPRDKVLVLHAGGLFGPWYHMEDIFSSIAEWPENYLLIIHTHKCPYPLCGFSIPDEYLNKKVFLSDEPVAFDQLDTVYSSCDIGIILQGPAETGVKDNLYYSDLSIGKLFHHLKVGVPVIIRDLPGFQELIAGTWAGVCVEGASDILPAIQKILKHHEEYKINALKLHEKFRFELHHNKLLERLEALSAEKQGVMERHGLPIEPKAEEPADAAGTANAASASPPFPDDGAGQDRAGSEFWNQERAHEGSGTPSFRSAIKRVLDVKHDVVFRSLLAPVPQGGSLLEIGCAPGWILARLGRIRSDLELYGIDYAPRGVEEARSFLADASIPAEIALGDLREYEREQGFDAVVSAGLIEHYDDPVPVVAHHARIAGPGNLVLVTVPNFATPLARETFRWADPDYFGTHNLGVMRADRLAEILREAGLSEIEAGYGGHSVLYAPAWRGVSFQRVVYRMGARLWNATFALLPASVQPWNCYVWARGRVSPSPKA